MNKEQKQLKEQKVFEKAKKAEKMMQTADWSMLQEYIENSRNKIKDFLVQGIEDTNTYWKYVGKFEMLKDLDTYLKRLIEKRNGLAKQRAGEGDDEAGDNSDSGEPQA